VAGIFAFYPIPGCGDAWCRLARRRGAAP